MSCTDVPDLGQFEPLGLRPLLLHRAAREEIRAMPKSVRSALGELLRDLQSGRSLTMPHSRPMPSVAAGVAELRVRDASGEYRAFWKSSEKGILVMHAFMKKTPATPWRVMALVQRRLKEMQHDAP